MRKRTFKVCKTIGLLVLIGMAYAWIYQKTRVGIPCLFRKLTELYCPGCGMTHMCMNLLQFKFRDALLSQPVIFCLMPAGGMMAIRWGIRYIKDGTKHFTKGEERLLIVILIALVGFCIFRNIRDVLGNHIFF